VHNAIYPRGDRRLNRRAAGLAQGGRVHVFLADGFISCAASQEYPWWSARSGVRCQVGFNHSSFTGWSASDASDESSESSALHLHCSISHMHRCAQLPSASAAPSPDVSAASAGSAAPCIIFRRKGPRSPGLNSSCNSTPRRTTAAVSSSPGHHIPTPPAQARAPQQALQPLITEELAHYARKRLHG
jgi:hypothetical protein